VNKSFKHKGLNAFWDSGQTKGLKTSWLRRTQLFLDHLDAIEDPNEMDFTGTGFHRLKGNRKQQYALKLSGNHRLLFEWDGHDVINIDIEDYH
jgi:proteic killer suppression protein